MTATLTTLPVRCEPTGGLIDLFADPAEPVRGVLTTDHAASSHGLPVFVRADGVAMGPADLGAVRLHADGPVHTPEWSAHDAAEVAAADSVSSGGTHAPAAFAGRKYLPGVCEMLAAAAAAGYDVYRLHE